MMCGVSWARGNHWYDHDKEWMNWWSIVARATGNRDKTEYRVDGGRWTMVFLNLAGESKIWRESEVESNIWPERERERKSGFRRPKPTN